MRNENSTYGSVSLTLGTIWLFLIGITVLRILMGYYWGFMIMVFLSGYVLIFVLPLLTIIYGIVGLVKDRKIPMAIIGLNLGIIDFIIIFIYFLIAYLPYPPITI